MKGIPFYIFPSQSQFQSQVQTQRIIFTVYPSDLMQHGSFSLSMSFHLHNNSSVFRNVAGLGVKAELKHDIVQARLHLEFFNSTSSETDIGNKIEQSIIISFSFNSSIVNMWKCLAAAIEDNYELCCRWHIFGLYANCFISKERKGTNKTLSFLQALSGPGFQTKGFKFQLAKIIVKEPYCLESRFGKTTLTLIQIPFIQFSLKVTQYLNTISCFQPFFLRLILGKKEFLHFRKSCVSSASSVFSDHLI